MVVGRFAAVLLMTSCLTPVVLAVGAASARADGGNGGGTGGGAGASGFSGANGQPATGAGGGGGGAAGGAVSGGTGGNSTGGAGGSGGTSGSPNGQGGGASGAGGGGGGGGGFNGNGAGVANINVVAPLTGGSGGDGGFAIVVGSGGGGGGGGYGAIVTGGGASSNASTITGGAGGGGGGGGGGVGSVGGNGGSGGVGVQFTGSGATFTNNGVVTGGNGGAAGSGPTAGVAGTGGAGIVGSDLTIINNGTITGGSAGGGGAQANAITFTGGANTLTMGSGATFGGNIDVTGSLNLNQATAFILSNAITGTGSVIKSGIGNLVLTGANNYTGGTTVSQGILQIGTSVLTGRIVGGLTIASGASMVVNNGNLLGLTSIANAGSLTVNGSSSFGAIPINLTGGFVSFGGSSSGGNATITATNANVAFSGTSTAANATLVTNSGATTFIAFGGSGGQARAITNAGGSFDLSALSSAGTTLGSIEGAGTYLLGSKQLTVGSNNLSTTVSGVIADGGLFGGTGGSLVKTGTGTLILTGANTYTGGTTVLGGILQGNTTSLQGNIVNNASVVFNQATSGTYAGAMSGTGGMTLQGGGTLTMTGNNTYTGATNVSASNLIVNGSLASSVTLDSSSTLGGSGSIGGLVSNGATLAPGNSIGTLTVNGSFTQNGGTYVVEANAAGQSDRVNVNGTATINGGTVQVAAAPGNYGTSTTYTILNATGGVSGAYSSVSSNFAFLTPSLSYNANNVFLTLALQGNAFSGFSGNSANQRAVGLALDQSYANASGDFATVINALAGLSTSQASPALDAISGQQYAGFGTTNVNAGAMFMNTLGQQMTLARSGSAPGTRIALAPLTSNGACEVEACDTDHPLSAWFSGLGGLGSVQGNGNSSTLTYNFGGAAAGLDYRLDPRFLVGLGVGYGHGTQWVNSFMGQGWTDSVSVAAYGSFTQDGFYTDALAGYAYFNNQMQRQIQIPGLQPRTASGSTGANQFLTQVETGYKVGLWERAAMSATPFGRLQFSTATQNAFTESGAQSLNLNVAQQTTNSLRTVLGAEFDTSFDLANQRHLDLGVRLGWQHEFADTARPVTAAFAGAPAASFTVYGATPTRDAAIIGFSAGTTVVQATQLYVRYDGQVGSGADNHAVTVGVRFTW